MSRTSSQLRQMLANLLDLALAADKWHVRLDGNVSQTGRYHAHGGFAHGSMSGCESKGSTNRPHGS
jgi:hypothetical protein